MLRSNERPSEDPWQGHADRLAVLEMPSGTPGPVRGPFDQVGPDRIEVHVVQLDFCFLCFMKWLNRPGPGNHTMAWTGSGMTTTRRFHVGVSSQRAAGGAILPLLRNTDTFAE